MGGGLLRFFLKLAICYNITKYIYMQNFNVIGSEQIKIGNLLKKLKKCERGIDNFRGQIASFSYQGYKGGGRVL